MLISINKYGGTKMGAGNFDLKAYQDQASKVIKSENSGFTAKSMCEEFNPANVSMRFSKKGPFNEFRDVITVLIGLDVTGSMDIIPKSLLEGKLGNLMVDLKETYNRPNENLQISFAGIGDAESDSAPLQVTHFESDNRFAQQLQKIWLEGGGGGNGAESYNLLWWYAANKTHLNYVKQDGRKGILITIGDDNVHPKLTANEIQMWLDPKYDGGNITNEELLKAVQEQYHVYHIVITNGDAYKYDYLKKAYKTDEQKQNEAKHWKVLLGNNNVMHTESKGVADAIAEIVKRHRPLQHENIINLSEKEWEKRNKETLSDEQWEEVLSYALCPLTRKFMEHPVSWDGGKRAYEKQAVEDFVRKHQKDPITRKKLTLSELALKPNLNIAQLCANYKPFFDALSEDRKERLILLALQDSIHDEPKKTDENIANPHAFFVKHEPEQMKKKLEDIQSGLECPITKEIMDDPVILVATGQTYERKAIEEWLMKHNTDPLTREELPGLQAFKDLQKSKELDDLKKQEELQNMINKLLVSNYTIKSMCHKARSELKFKQ